MRERRGRGQAVEPGHLDVEQRDVRPVATRGGHDDLVAAADLGDDLEVVLELEQRGERGAHQRLVVGEQQPDHVARLDGDRAGSRGRRRGAGTSTRSRQPRERAAPAVTRAAGRVDAARAARSARCRRRPTPPRPSSTISIQSRPERDRAVLARASAAPRW